MIFELCVREAKALERLGAKLFDHTGSFFGVTFAEVLKLEVVDSTEFFVPPSLHQESDRQRDPSIFFEPDVPCVRRVTSCSFYNCTRWLKCQSVLLLMIFSSNQPIARFAFVASSPAPSGDSWPFAIKTRNSRPSLPPMVRGSMKLILLSVTHVIYAL